MNLEEWEAALGRWSMARAATGGGKSENGVASASATDSAKTATRDATEAGEDLTAGSQVERPQTAWLDSVEQPAMACEFEVLLNRHQYAHGIEHARDSLRVVHDLEKMFSIYRPLSDFSTVNRWGHQRPVAVRVDVARLLLLSQEISRQTGGAFDITAGSLSEVWGFSRRQGRKPDEEELVRALGLVGWDKFNVDEVASTIRIEREGVRLNPGAIGKGYALDRVANQMLDVGVEHFLIHGGRSSVLARGTRHDLTVRDGWWIALAHPLRWEEKLGRIRITNRALGTSGAGKQFFHYQGVRYSHVIDPRTGWPAQGVLSATALCRSGALADALATAFMVMGVESTREFCRRHPSASAILVSTEPGSSRLSIDRINLPDEDWDPGRELRTSH